MSLSKRYLKNNKCKVTFRFEKEAARRVNAKDVFLVGDFNQWNETSHPLQALKSGEFTLVLDLEAGREYQYKYLVNGSLWENDWQADKYAPTTLGDNSVVQLQQTDSAGA